MGDLQLGGRVVEREGALDYARRYLTDGAGWSYPSYDAYDEARATGPLTDGDFLAPMLLNVRIKVRTYEGLQARREELDRHLARIPQALDLADATTADLGILGDLFSVLDEPGVYGARGTTLAKVLHRKRPGFIPLYDERVRVVYQTGNPAPVPPQRGRSWQEFMPMFAGAVQTDLRRETDFWDRITGLAPSPAITRLRALDIVAWWAGGQ